MSVDAIPILCVDDEEPLRRLLSRMLTVRGYRVVVAGSVAEARVELERENFPLVLCDITMPGGSGLELAAELAETGPDTAVLMVTAHDDPDLAARALDLGAYGYILKPFEPTELLVNIDSALRRRAAELENRGHRVRLEGELVQSREDLSESDERFRRLADDAPDVVFRYALGPEAGFDYVSPSVTRLTGFTPYELYLDRAILWRLVHPDDRRNILRLRKATEPSTVTVRWRKRDGSELWAEQSNVPIFADDGSLVAIEGIARDVTERKLGEEAHQESEHRFRSLMGNIPGALYSRALDAEQTMHFVTHVIEEISGYPASDFIDSSVRTYASIVVEVDREQVQRTIGEAVARGGPFSLAYRIVHADGSERWVGEKGQAIRDERGNILSLDGTISDISERKLLEHDRDRTEIELRVAQKLEAVGQLAASIAHEIDAPVQLVGDSVHFLGSSFGDLTRLVGEYRAICAAAAGGAEGQEILARLESVEAAADLACLQERVPAALEQTLVAIERVSSIVKAMTDFALSSRVEKANADLDQALRTTLIVASDAHR